MSVGPGSPTSSASRRSAAAERSAAHQHEDLGCDLRCCFDVGSQGSQLQSSCTVAVRPSARVSMVCHVTPRCAPPLIEVQDPHSAASLAPPGWEVQQQRKGVTKLECSTCEVVRMRRQPASAVHVQARRVDCRGKVHRRPQSQRLRRRRQHRQLACRQENDR